MTITPQQKALKVLQLIRELRQLGIPSEPVDIEASDLREIKIAPEDFVRIVKRLTSEGLVSDKAQEVIQLDGRLTHRHEITVLDDCRFAEYADRLHSEVHSDIDHLLGDKFLAIADVLYDVYGQLQIASGSEVYIDVVPQVVRFPNLFPVDSVSMRDRYGDLRMEAARYLLDRKTFTKTELIRGGHRWESRVKIEVDRIVFQSFCDRFWEVYARRVKEGETKDKTTPSVQVPDVVESKSTRGSKQYSKLSLSDEGVEFDDEAAQIKVGVRVCQLPPFKNGHYLCRAIFEQQVNQPIDWSTVYEKMSGFYEKYYGKPSGDRDQWRSVYDAMLHVNKLVKEVANTADDLFTWSEKTIRRNY